MKRLSVLLAGVMVLGWISLQRLPLEYLPAFSSSNISVSAPYPSSSPEEIERLIVRPLEDSLGTINGIETLSASASASQARVNVGFVDGHAEMIKNSKMGYDKPRTSYAAIWARDHYRDKL